MSSVDVMMKCKDCETRSSHESGLLSGTNSTNGCSIPSSSQCGLCTAGLQTENWARGANSDFSNCRGRGQWCNREPMAYNKLRGSMDMFSKQIFEIVTT